MNPEKTDILIVGGGAREHALAWKLKQSTRVGTIYVAPGNAGTEEFCTNVPIAPTSTTELLSFAEKNHIGLTVVGSPEALVLGIVDQFKRARLRIFGPSKVFARIETSKEFGKQLMEEIRIPIAVSRTFTSAELAHAYAHAFPFPLVVKPDRSTDGKAVYICHSVEEADVAIDDILVRSLYGGDITSVLVEEYLVGEALSIHALADGVNCTLFPVAGTNRRLGANDTGKNTLGMGSITPVPWVTGDMMLQIENKIIKPLIHALARTGTPFQGVLFPTVVLTIEGPKVLKLETHFGDLETPGYMRLMTSDLLDLIEDCVDGGIGTHIPRWDAAGVVNVALVSDGYPDETKTGAVISGVKEASQMENVVVFHDNTVHTDSLQTAGGRVFSVTATGAPIARAYELVYQAVGKIIYEGKYLRPDIGEKTIYPAGKNVRETPKY